VGGHNLSGQSQFLSSLFCTSLLNLSSRTLEPFISFCWSHVSCLSISQRSCYPFTTTLIQSRWMPMFLILEAEVHFKAGILQRGQSSLNEIHSASTAMATPAVTVPIVRPRSICVA